MAMSWLQQSTLRVGAMYTREIFDWVTECLTPVQQDETMNEADEHAEFPISEAWQKRRNLGRSVLRAISVDGFRCLSLLIGLD